VSGHRHRSGGTTGDEPILLVDIGGTKLAVALARAGEIVARARIDGMANVGSARDLVDLVVQAAEGVGWDRGAEGAGSVAVAVPGTIDRTGKTIISAANLPLDNYPLAQALHDRLGGRDLLLEDDANCGAIGEHRRGPGRGHDDIAYVALSTGVGMGSITSGALTLGANRRAGEIGHLLVVPDGRGCGCGRSGCLEAYFSGRAFAQAGESLVAAGRAPSLAEHAGLLSGRDVVEAAYAGDPDCGRLIRDAIAYLTIGIQAVIAVMDPSVLIFGGGLMNNAELATDVVNTTKAATRASTTTFARAALGDDSVLYGALELAMNPNLEGRIT
jgi:glucokinase